MVTPLFSNDATRHTHQCFTFRLDHQIRMVTPSTSSRHFHRSYYYIRIVNFVFPLLGFSDPECRLSAEREVVNGRDSGDDDDLCVWDHECVVE